MMSDLTIAGPDGDHSDHSHDDAAAKKLPSANKLQWKVNSAQEEVEFELEMAAGTWMGIGLGAHTMKKSDGADMIMCSCDAQKQVTCHDMKAVGHQAPEKDAT